MSQNNSNWEDETAQAATLDPPTTHSEQHRSEIPAGFISHQQTLEDYR